MGPPYGVEEAPVSCYCRPVTEVSLLAPSFVRRLAAREVRTVLLAGCGGGFDFVHGTTLLPELWRLGKQVVLLSYSFGRPERIGGRVDRLQAEPLVVRLTDDSTPDDYYAPEVLLRRFLALRAPGEPPDVYACYARDFTVDALEAVYRALGARHDIDAIVLVDGGSDSLMVGDEEGLGDPIEDAVSVAAASRLDLRSKVLLSIGLGADRFNHVSDAASLRAIAELSRSGGYLGAVALEPGSAGLELYREALDSIYAQSRFRSVLAGAIVSAAHGAFGAEDVPLILQDRLLPGQCFLWPLMAMVFGFDVDRVAERSLTCQVVAEAKTPLDAAQELAERRSQTRVRAVEELPRHLDYRNPAGRLF